MNIYKAHNKRKTLIHHCIILANYSPSSGMVGMLRICKNARQAPRAASQEARMCDCFRVRLGLTPRVRVTL